MAAGADTVLTIFLQTSLLMVRPGFMVMVTTQSRSTNTSFYEFCRYGLLSSDAQGEMRNEEKMVTIIQCCV